MKREIVDSTVAQQIVTAMVMSREFLISSRSFLNPELIEEKHLRTIAKWCHKYFDKYSEAPKSSIESIYEKWSSSDKVTEEAVDAVHDVLENLSHLFEQDEELNVP